MALPHTGFDNNLTYFEHNLKLKKIPNIFVHGVGLDNTMWLPQKKYFSDKEIIFYDLLNHGKSKKGFSELYFENFNIQLYELIKYLNIDKFNLIGFSIGALIAQHFTSKYNKKINKLVIIASVYKRSLEQINRVKNRYKIALKGESITNDSINRWFNKKYLEKYPEVLDYFKNILEKKSNNNFLPAYKLFVESDNYLLNFKNFNMPTLIMTGENEIGSTPNMSKKLNKEIKNSKLFIISKAKHMATFEEADQVNNEINNFLE